MTSYSNISCLIATDDIVCPPVRYDSLLSASELNLSSYLLLFDKSSLTFILSCSMSLSMGWWAGTGAGVSRPSASPFSGTGRVAEAATPWLDWLTLVSAREVDSSRLVAGPVPSVIINLV